MAKSVHQFEIRGVDKSAGAFNSIKAKAAVTGSQIRSMVGGAFAAVGGYLTFAAVKGGIDQLGHLSDIAQKTSTDVGELTGAVAAFGALGIQNMGVDQLGKAFDYMAKTTGRSGMEGFYQTIDQLGKIPDVAKRGQEAMRIFGRSGMEFMPLINGADESVDALRTVVNAMPAVSQSAANAGDAMSDAMAFAAKQVQSVWLEGLAFLANKMNNDYTGDVRTAALAAGNSLAYYTKMAVAKCIAWYSKLRNALKVYGETLGTLVGATYEKLFGSGGSWQEVLDMTSEAWSDGLKEYDEEAKKIDQLEAERTARFQREYEQRAVAVQHFAAAYDKAAVSIKGRNKKGGALDVEPGRQTRISNDLIMGGSNAATRAQILGPTLQSESKKQTSLLEKIAANTEKTADNTEETANGDNLGVID